MPNLQIPRQEMPMQDPLERIHNVEEVTLGYTPQIAFQEATRCLDCKHKPCVQGCPVNVNIPDFIQAIVEGDLQEAYKIISLTSSLPAVCGRVCPQETQCEERCVRGIKAEPVAIGRLERFVADYAREHGYDQVSMPVLNGHKVAIVGAGPAGLAAAGDLAKKGYEVKVFEALHQPGGVLMYGIPEFRLPKEIVQTEIQKLSQMGVEFECNYVVGHSGTIDELLEEGYEAVFVGSGAGLPNFMNIPGEELNGVYSANEFLTRYNLMKAYEEGSHTPILKPKVTVVIGGGNVAMDAARCARRLGSEVHVVYRRSLDELPARHEEVEHAMDEGIQFDVLNNPVAIHGDESGNVCEIECVKMELGEPDESGRRRPTVIEGSNFSMPVDCVIMAIGTSPNPLICRTTEGLVVNHRGCLIVDENEQTTRKGVYAGGDAVTGAATVISAMGAGKKAAKAIDEALRGSF